VLCVRRKRLLLRATAKNIDRGVAARFLSHRSPPVQLHHSPADACRVLLDTKFMVPPPPLTMAARCCQQLVLIFYALLLLSSSTPYGNALPVYQERALLNGIDVEALLPIRTTEKPAVRRDFSPELEAAGRDTQLKLTACSAEERSRAWPLRRPTSLDLAPYGVLMFPNNPPIFDRFVTTMELEIRWVHIVLTPVTVAAHPKPTQRLFASFRKNALASPEMARAVFPPSPALTRCPFLQWEAKVVAQARKGPVDFFFAYRYDHNRSEVRPVWIHSTMRYVFKEPNTSVAVTRHEGWGFDNV